MIKEHVSDPFWSGNKSMAAKSMSDIKALKEQAKKEREKKAAAQAAVQSYRFSKDITFNMKPRPANDESFLSKSVKHVLGDFGAFKPALDGNKTSLYLGLDNSVPGTPEVIEFESDSPFHGYVNDLLKPKNGIKYPPPLTNLIHTVNGDLSFTQPKNKNADSAHHVKGSVKPKPPRLKMHSKEPEGIKTPNKIESILMEMTQGLAPPLSDIETPGKLSGDRFTFPKTASGKDVKNENGFTEVMPLGEQSDTVSSKGPVGTNDVIDAELGKVVSLANGPDKPDKSGTERKLSSSSTSSSDDSSSDSSASSDSEDEQQGDRVNDKDVAAISLNSSLLSELKPTLTKNSDSPLNNNNNNYILDKTSLNGPINTSVLPYQNNVHSDLSYQNNGHNDLSYQNNVHSDLSHQEKTNQTLDMGKTNFKSDPSLIPINGLFDPVESWEIEKPISPLDNGLFADLVSFPGPEEENFVDDIFKADDDITKEASVLPVSVDTKKDDKKEDSFTKDSVFDSELERSLPKPCLPRRGSLYRKDSEQADGRNIWSSKSNETKDKSKSKTTRIDSSSFPSVKVNSGSMGYPCPTKAQLKAPVRKHSLSESSSTSADEFKTIRKNREKNYKLNQDKVIKKDKSVKKDKYKTKLECVDDDKTKLNLDGGNSSPIRNETPQGEKLDSLKVKTELMLTPPTVGQTKLTDETIQINNITNDFLKDDVSVEPEEKFHTTIHDVNFEENLKSTLSPMTSPIHSLSNITFLSKNPLDIKTNFHLDLPDEEKQTYISEVSHGLKPLISPIKDLLSPIKDHFECKGNFPVEHESTPMDIEDDSEGRQQSEIILGNGVHPNTSNTLETDSQIKNEPTSCTEVKEELDNSDDSRNCFDAFQDDKHTGSKQLRIRIPLRLIKLKHSALRQCENKNADGAKNIKAEADVLKANDDCEIDVEAITDSPIKRKRKLSEGSCRPHKSDDTIFKSPRDVSSNRLIVRIDLSRLKRHPAKGPDKIISKKVDDKGSKKRRVSTESNFSMKVESQTEKKDGNFHNESNEITSPLISVKEEETEGDDVQSLKQEPPLTQSSSDKFKRVRGRPPKSNKPSSESPLTTNLPDQKSIVQSVDNSAEPKDPNICHECGTLRRDIDRDAKTLASYKKIYSTFLNEGSRVKHTADSLTNPVERANTYIEAALYYVQYLVGLDSSGKLSLKQGLDEYSQIASECIHLVE